MKKSYALLLIVCLLALVPQHALAQGTASKGVFRRNDTAIMDSYIVVFKDSVPRGRVDAFAAQLARQHGGTVGYTYQYALRGFSVQMSEPQAEALSRNPQIEYVEEDTLVEGADVQNSPTWALDRLDQRSLPLNASYNYANSGAGVNAYVIDSGIRMTHQEFGGRAALAFDNVNDGRNGTDCNGHGTHVAGIIGGNTYGVAKGAKLWSVRVLNCSNQALASSILAGIDWVAGNHIKPAVANMSFASGVGNDAMDLAVRNLIAAGVATVVAAGNNNGDAGLRSPARVREAITVAATDQNDTKTSLSNFGSVVDVFAPGAAIVSAHSTDDAAIFSRTGTSSAAPFVAGLVARYLSTRLGDAPDAVAQAITSNATPDKVVNPGAGSPNRLAYAAVTISDDFNDNARDAAKWGAPTGTDFTVAEQNGRLEVTPGVTATGSGGYASATTVDLTDARISVEVSTPKLINYFASYLLLYSPNGDWMAFATGGQVFMMRHQVNGVMAETRITYNPAQHRFWRLRHHAADDSINWEVSPNGVTWTVLRSIPRPFSITNLHTLLIVSKDTATTPTMTVAFDNLWHEANPTPAVALADDFDDNAINPAMWVISDPASPTTIKEQNGRIEVTPQPNTAGHNSLSSAGRFDFRDKTLQVEAEPASQTGGIWTYFGLSLDASNNFITSTGMGVLICDATVNGVNDRTQLTWDATMRFWRYRHDIDASTVNFETSADGTTWTTRKTIAAPFALSSMQAMIGSGAQGVINAAPGITIFDNFRLERYRPLFPLSDNFNDNTRDAKKWNAPTAADFTVAEQNGRLEITPGASSTSFDGYWSATNIDLTDARASVEAVSIPATAYYGTYFLLSAGTGNYLLFGVGGQNLMVEETVGGVMTRTQIPYNAAQHRFWRIRHNRASDTINWETSADNVLWTVIRTAPRPFPVSNLQTLLIAGKSSTAIPSVTSIFDNLRIERNEGGRAR